jgi:hypothetical protein
MSDEEKNFHQYIKSLPLDDRIDAAHRDRLEQQLLQAMRQRASMPPGRAPRRPTTMLHHAIHSRVLKFSAAAAVLIAAALVIHFSTASPGRQNAAWAAEQTDAALQQMQTVRLKGSGLGSLDEFTGKLGLPPSGPVGFTMLARKAPHDNSSGDVRLDTSDGRIAVTTGGTSLFDPQTNTLFITDAHVLVIQPWLDSAFRMMKWAADEWAVTYGPDERTRRESVFVLCSIKKNQRSWWFQFDRQTKLPVRFKQWNDNTERQGEPSVVVDEISYNVPASDAEFVLAPPAGATVKNLRGMKLVDDSDRQSTKMTAEEWQQRVLNDREAGILVGDMTEPQAAEQVCRKLLETMIRDDQAEAGKFWPLVQLMDDAAWQKSRGQENPAVEIVSVGPAAYDPGCQTGLVVPCVVKLQDGSAKEVRLGVKIRHLDGVASCVVANPCGQPTPAGKKD